MKSLLLVTMCALGCGKDKADADKQAARENARAAERKAIEAENAAPVEKKPVKPAPPKGQATAELELTGAITTKLTGAIGMCGYTHLDGRDQGASFSIDTDELQFAVIAASDAELTEASVILNRHKPTRTSFVGKKGAGVSNIERFKGVTIDADLKQVVGREMVHVKGTITCQTP